MPEITARRTLMKSTPELWAALIDPEGLARQLPGVQGIRIVTTKRQRHIAWEGEQACGEVTLEPAGFGTKVTLTVARAEGPDAALRTPPASEGRPAEAGARAPAAKSPPTTPVARAPAPTPARMPRPEVTKPTGLFARLFRRAAPPSGGPAACQEAGLSSEPSHTRPEAPPPPPSPVLAGPEPADTPPSRDAELLETALDRLGANHHRPFSRG